MAPDRMATNVAAATLRATLVIAAVLFAIYLAWHLRQLLLLLGVPFALPLGVFAFIAEAVPFAGPWVAGIPIVLIAALESPLTGLLVAIWFIVLQQLEGFVITPLVQGHVVRVSPMVVLLAVLAGALLGGIVGAIIAIPIVAVIDVMIEEVILPLRQRQQDGNSNPPNALEESTSGA